MTTQHVPMSTIPAPDADAIVPSDSANQGPFRALYVGGAGDVTLVTLAGNARLFKAVPVGTTLHVGCVRVNSTGTTATYMVGLY
jgi:hypothetical protein